MKTRYGIYHNLKESEYRFTIGTVRFYFSSELYMHKFMTTYMEEKTRFNRALMKVYKDKFEIEFDMLAWIRLYTLIEKRGFYIQVEGVDVECPEDLVFAGMLNSKKK